MCPYYIGILRFFISQGHPIFKSIFFFAERQEGILRCLTLPYFNKLIKETVTFRSINYWKYLREQSPTSHHSLDITRTQYVFVFSELFRVNRRSAIGKCMGHCNWYHPQPPADDTSQWFYACAQAQKTYWSLLIC